VGGNLKRHLERVHRKKLTRGKEDISRILVAVDKRHERGPKRGKAEKIPGLRVKRCTEAGCPFATCYLRKHLQRRHRITDNEELDCKVRSARDYKPPRLSTLTDDFRPLLGHNVENDSQDGDDDYDDACAVGGHIDVNTETTTGETEQTPASLASEDEETSRRYPSTRPETAQRIGPSSTSVHKRARVASLTSDSPMATDDKTSEKENSKDDGIALLIVPSDTDDNGADNDIEASSQGKGSESGSSGDETRSTNSTTATDVSSSSRDEDYRYRSSDSESESCTTATSTPTTTSFSLSGSDSGDESGSKQKDPADPVASTSSTTRTRTRSRTSGITRGAGASADVAAQAGELEDHDKDEEGEEESDDECGDSENGDANNEEYFTFVAPTTPRHEWLTIFYRYLGTPSAGGIGAKVRLQHASQVRTLLECIDAGGTDVDALSADEGNAVWTNWVELQLGEKAGGTIRAYLCSLEKFLDCVLLERVRERVPEIKGETLALFRRMKKCMPKWRSTVSRICQGRENERMVDECLNRLTDQDVEEFLSSPVMQAAADKLRRAPRAKHFSRRSCLDVRDFLICKLVTSCGTRPGALEEARLSHFRDCNETRSGNFVMLIHEHKTKKKGPAIVTIDAETYAALARYVDHVLPLYASHDNNRLFVNHDGQPFVRGTLGKRVTALWSKSKVRPDVRVSTTMVRKSIVTSCHQLAIEAEEDQISRPPSTPPPPPPPPPPTPTDVVFSPAPSSSSGKRILVASRYAGGGESVTMSALRKTLSHSKQTAERCYVRDDLTKAGDEAFLLIREARRRGIEKSKKEKRAKEMEKRKSPLPRCSFLSATLAAREDGHTSDNHVPPCLSREDEESFAVVHKVDNGKSVKPDTIERPHEDKREKREQEQEQKEEDEKLREDKKGEGGAICDVVASSSPAAVAAPVGSERNNDEEDQEGEEDGEEEVVREVPIEKSLHLSAEETTVPKKGDYDADYHKRLAALSSDSSKEWTPGDEDENGEDEDDDYSVLDTEEEEKRERQQREKEKTRKRAAKRKRHSRGRRSSSRRRSRSSIRRRGRSRSRSRSSSRSRSRSSSTSESNDDEAKYRARRHHRGHGGHRHRPRSSSSGGSFRSKRHPWSTEDTALVLQHFEQHFRESGKCPVKADILRGFRRSSELKKIFKRRGSDACYEKVKNLFKREKIRGKRSSPNFLP